MTLAKVELKEKRRVRSAGRVVETRQGGEAFSPIQKHRRVDMRRRLHPTAPVQSFYYTAKLD